MILVIRGHIRVSFKTTSLYDLIERIHKLFPDLKIFIHTWNIFANNISWRDVTINNNAVDDKIIYNYFGKLNNCIKHIIIEDDKNIQLNGNLVGNICNSLMPIIGWKNYWYGKYKIIDYIYNNVQCSDEMIVNLRFDILNNSNSFNEKIIIDFIQKHRQVKITRNYYLYNHYHNGIDNIYIGNVNAIDTNNGLSRDGAIPWKSKKDMSFFMNKTKHNIVIMGKNTYFSLPAGNRPLKNRFNIVLTSNPLMCEENANVLFTNNDNIHQDILANKAKYYEMHPYLHKDFKIFFIGGKTIYDKFIPLCQTVWVTQIKMDYKCDLFIDGNHLRGLTSQVHEEDDELKIMEYTRS